MLQRHSSRRTPLDQFLPDALRDAQAYDRIAGYFSSSILEIAGEAIEDVTGVVRMVCNSDLYPADVATARAAALALRREWNGILPEDFTPPLQARLARLYGLLKSDKLQVRVLPDSRFGLIHGKAGVITRRDETPITFLGSANESRSAWTRNYEIVWTDDNVESAIYGEGEADALALPVFLQQAYHHAEEFCREVGHRPGLSSGFLKTLLLRRVGSSIEAGRRTAEKMLSARIDENDEEAEEDAERQSALYPLEVEERSALQAFADALQNNQDDDPKLYEVIRLLESGWRERGCILFSQYYDTVFWISERLSARFPEETIAVYAGAARSGILRNQQWSPLSRDEIKRQVQSGAIRLLVGTDAASEGLNLQRLGTLINIDLPWNPTRLEQRKGRIQRIGQVHATVELCNLRYRGSVEDRVHQLLSERLANIHSIFGQLPDTLEDVWVEVALSQEAEAKKRIEAVPTTHPFELRYDKIESVDWESCATPLAQEPQLEALRRGWS